MNRLLLIDGHNLLFQMFFGMPARITGRNGQAIQGTLGFIGALLKMIRTLKPSHVAVLFDGEHENDRTELDAAYKSNRPDWNEVEDGDNPFSQLPDIYRALDFLKIPHTEITDGETDDAMATYALTLPEDFELIIASFDSDFFQLVSPRVRIYRYRGDCSVTVDEDYILQKCGVPPRQYADWKCLVGDNSDRIKGIDRIGPKTAARLLSCYESIDEILEHLENITPAAIQASLCEGRERLYLNRRLIKLDTHASLPFLPEQLKYIDQGLRTGDVLSAIGLR